MNFLYYDFFPLITSFLVKNLKILFNKNKRGLSERHFLTEEKGKSQFTNFMNLSGEIRFSQQGLQKEGSPTIDFVYSCDDIDSFEKKF